jgi:hypothetical protein
MESNYAEMRYRYRIRGEKWGFQRTDIMRRFLFPESLVDRVNHLPESIVWARMTQQYPAWYINECLRVYYDDDCGQERLTQSNLARKNPIGTNLLAKTALEVEIPYFHRSPKYFLRMAANYSRSSFQLRQTVLQQYTSLKSGIGRMLWGVMLPIGLLLHWRDRRYL